MANQKIDAIELMAMDEAAGRATASAAAPDTTAATRRHAEAAKALGLRRQQEIIEQADKAAHAGRLGFRPMTREQAVAAMAPGREVVTERRGDEFRARRRTVHLLLALPVLAIAGGGALAVLGDAFLGVMLGAMVAILMLLPWGLSADNCGLKFVATGLDDLKDPVPLGVLLRVAELRRLGVFDKFEVVAPAEMTSKPWVGKDPIVLGRCGNQSFFVARWDPAASIK